MLRTKALASFAIAWIGFTVILLDSRFVFCEEIIPKQCASVLRAASKVWIFQATSNDGLLALQAEKMAESAEMAAISVRKVVRTYSDSIRHMSVSKRKSKSTYDRLDLLAKLARSGDFVNRHSKALAAWANAGKTCGFVLMVFPQHPDFEVRTDVDIICSVPPLRMLVGPQCKECDRATQEMQRVVGRSIGGRHTPEELLERVRVNAKEMLEILGNKRLRWPRVKGHSRRSIKREVKRITAAATAFHETSQTGVVLWRGWEDLVRGKPKQFLEHMNEDISKGHLKPRDIPKAGSLGAVETACQTETKEPDTIEKSAPHLQVNPSQGVNQKNGKQMPGAKREVVASAASVGVNSVSWTDPTSGLTWQNPPAADKMKWDAAKQYCADLSLDGGGWHLPTIGELRTLIRGCPGTADGGSCNVKEGNCLAWSCRDSSCGGWRNGGLPAVGSYWPGEMQGACDTYWSSSAVEDSTGFAWLVIFNRGGIVGNGRVGDKRHARCVR